MLDDHHVHSPKRILEIFANWGPVRMRCAPEREAHIRVCNLSTGEELVVLQSAWNGVQNALEFEPDGQHFRVTPEVRRG